MNACIPLLDECLELRKLRIAFDQALGDDRLSPADCFKRILPHVSLAHMSKYFVRKRLALISRDVDEVAVETARAPLSVMIILARHSPFVVDMDQLRHFFKLSLDVGHGL